MEENIFPKDGFRTLRTKKLTRPCIQQTEPDFGEFLISMNDGQ